MANAEHSGATDAETVRARVRVARLGLWLIAAILAVRQVAVVLSTPDGERLTDLETWVGPDGPSAAWEGNDVAGVAGGVVRLTSGDAVAPAVEVALGPATPTGRSWGDRAFAIAPRPRTAATPTAA